MLTQPDHVWRLLLASGTTLAVLGWADLALLWYPLQFGDPQWEFATVSGTFEGMPLGTIGITMMLVGLIKLGWNRVVLLLCATCIVIALAVLAMSVVYLLDVPVALRSAPPVAMRMLKKSMAKTGLCAIGYTALYSWLAWSTWRMTRVARV